MEIYGIYISKSVTNELIALRVKAETKQVGIRWTTTFYYIKRSMKHKNFVPEITIF